MTSLSYEAGVFESEYGNFALSSERFLLYKYTHERKLSF